MILNCHRYCDAHDEKVIHCLVLIIKERKKRSRQRLKEAKFEYQLDKSIMHLSRQQQQKTNYSTYFSFLLYKQYLSLLNKVSNIFSVIHQQIHFCLLCISKV
jgi:hypothetical protein